MGTQGVPIGIPEIDIINLIIKYKGVVKKVAHEAGCSPETIYALLKKFPGAKAVLMEQREHRTETTLDLAEDVLYKAMDKADDDMNCALKASFFFLNNRGKSRGFSSLPELHNQQQMEVKNSQLSQLVDLLGPAGRAACERALAGRKRADTECAEAHPESATE